MVTVKVATPGSVWYNAIGFYQGPAFLFTNRGGVDTYEFSCLDHISNLVESKSGLYWETVNLHGFKLRPVEHFAIVGSLSTIAAQVGLDGATAVYVPGDSGTFQFGTATYHFRFLDLGYSGENHIVAPIYVTEGFCENYAGRTFNNYEFKAYSVGPIWYGTTARYGSVSYRNNLDVDIDPDTTLDRIESDILSHLPMLRNFFSSLDNRKKGLSVGESDVKITPLAYTREWAVAQLSFDQTHSTWGKIAADAYSRVNMGADSNGVAFTKEYFEMYSTVEKFISNLSTSRPLQSVASTYLGIHYGWKMTLLDTLEYLKLFESDLARYAKHKLCQASLKNADGLMTYTVYANPYIDLFRSVQDLAERLNAVLDLDNIWDLTPYSFVIDWILPIGDILSDIDSYYNIVTRYQPSAILQSWLQEKPLSPLNVVRTSTKVNGDVRLVGYLRKPGEKLITPSFDFAFNTTGFLSHSVEAGALVLANVALPKTSSIAMRWKTLKEGFLASMENRLDPKTPGTLGSFISNVYRK